MKDVFYNLRGWRRRCDCGISRVIIIGPLAAAIIGAGCGGSSGATVTVTASNTQVDSSVTRTCAAARASLRDLDSSNTTQGLADEQDLENAAQSVMMGGSSIPSALREDALTYDTHYSHSAVQVSDVKVIIQDCKALGP